MRAGTRYKRRGIDDDGFVANFVETEQVLLRNNAYASFVQLRGSIPLFWKQTGYKYRPVPMLLYMSEESGKKVTSAFRNHFKDLIRQYSKLVLVDLLNQTGAEASMGKAYKEEIKKLNHPNIKYAM